MEGFCRACLIRYDEPTELVPYTDRNRVMFKYCTGIQVQHNDDELFQLCKDCHVNMKLSCKFKKQCRTSDKKFKHYVALKEAGDAYDLSTFLKSNDESLRFPILNGNITAQIPGSDRENEDNESTCTSIRNFMSDILQGEEIPDTEAHLIKEVIEEDLLDDTLDSRLLEDDISRDTDFRDLSFSPFSTPHSTNHDHCYSPYVDKDLLNDYNNISTNDVPPVVYKEQTEDCPLMDTTEPTAYDQNKIDEPEGLFEEIVDENVNYVTQNENDIAVTNNINGSFHNESYYAAKALQNENEQFRTDSSYMENQDSLAVKHLLESNNDYFRSTNFSSYDAENVDINQFENNKHNISTLDVVKDVPEKCDKKVELTENYVLNIQETATSNNPNHVKMSIVIEAINKNRNDDKENKIDIIKDFKIENDKNFTLDDLLVSPTEHSKAPGASTPMINNILFGEKLDLDDSMGHDDIDEVNFLDEMLTRGVKEFSIHTLESQAANVYDLEQCYCKNCDKKFSQLKGLKIHLVKFHGIKLARTKSRDFDKRSRQCTICGNTYNNFKSFQRHIAKHQNRHTGPQCSICKIDFFSEKKLTLHMKVHSGEVHLVDKKEYIKSDIICTQCGRGFKTSRLLSAHMKRHSRNYLFNCDYCSKGFYRKHDIVTHIRVHTGEKPYACKFCDMKFRAKYCLVRHMRVHMDDKPFRCDNCSKTFVLKCDLKRHITTSKLCKLKRIGLKLNNNKKFNKKFTTRRALENHKNGYKSCTSCQGSGASMNKAESGCEQKIEVDNAIVPKDLEMIEV